MNRKQSATKSSFLLRRFSILYLVFALTPLLILFYFYLGHEWDSNKINVSQGQIAVLIAILG